MVDEIIKEILTRPGREKIGMILSHVGIVRGFSRDGTPVNKVKVRVDEKALEEILIRMRQRPGIFAVEVKINEGELSLGEVLMVLVVAGDFRENVINTLKDTLDEIKARVTQKEERLEA